jgi:hypothetical protein
MGCIRFWRLVSGQVDMSNRFRVSDFACGLRQSLRRLSPGIQDYTAYIEISVSYRKVIQVVGEQDIRCSLFHLAMETPRPGSISHLQTFQTHTREESRPQSCVKRYALTQTVSATALVHRLHSHTRRNAGPNLIQYILSKISFSSY